MTMYAYKAKDETGKTVRGSLAVKDERELFVRLKEEGLFLIDASIRRDGGQKSTPSRHKVNRKELIGFTHYLASMLSAGVALPHGLRDLRTQVKSVPLRKVIDDISKEVEAGSSFSNALKRHPSVFPGAYIGVVEAGEATGDLEGVLANLTSFLEWQQGFAEDIKGATIYPLVVSITVLAMFLLLLTFAVPKLASLLEQLNTTLPAITLTVIRASDLFRSFWYIPLAAIVSGVIFIRLSPRQSRSRHLLDKAKLHLPLMGNLNREIALSRFAQYFAMLYRSGVGVIDTFKIMEGVVGNEVLAKEIGAITQKVESGSSIAEAMRASKEFPVEMVRMMNIGESTGDLDDALNKISEYYNKEASVAVKNLFGVFQPMLIVVIAAFVLVMAMSFYLPIFKIVGGFRGVR